MDEGLSWGLLILRFALGFTFFYHGAQKLFGWYGGPGLAKATVIMESMGFIPGKRNAFMAGLTELLGGMLMLLGFLTPLGAMLIFSVMVVATFAVHIKNGFGLSNRGYEYNFVLGLAALCTAFTGAGQFSLDATIGQNWSGVTYGLGTFVIGSIGAGLQLAMRKHPTKVGA